MAKPLTITRYDGTEQTWESLNPITVGQNVYGSGDNATTPLLNSSNQINSVFLTNYVDKSSAQTIIGTKTFGNSSNVADVKVQNGALVLGGVAGSVSQTTSKISFQDTSNTELHYIKANTSGVIFSSAGNNYGFYNYGFTPTANNILDLGRDGNYASGRWNNIHLAGSLIKYNGTTGYNLTLPNKTGTVALTSDIPANEIYWAVYGTTTGEEIAQAITDGKYVCCKYNNSIYGNVMLHSGESRYYLTGIYGSYTRRAVRCSTSGATWTTSDTTFLGSFKVDNTTFNASSYTINTINANYNASSNKLATASDIPSTYLKGASVSNDTLTLTKQDNTTVTFTPSGSGSGDTNNYSMAYNLVVNSNGYQYNGYKFADVTISGLNYTIKQFQVSTTSVKVTDTSTIKAYLKVMTGRDRLPEYDEDCPINDFIICTSNNTMWKMQYDSTNGLLAIRVDNSPFANSIQTITLASTQIVSQTPLVVSLTEAQQSIVENLKNSIIKIDISAFYTAIGLDSPYAWIKRNAVKNIGDNTNGAVTYEFVCSSNDIDSSGNMSKLGSLGIYYFYQTVGTYSTYNKKIIIASGKINLSTISHATNLVNGSNGGLQMNNSASGYGSTGERAISLHNTSLASGAHSVAIGLSNTASGYGSFATGSNNTTSGTYSVSIGNNNSVSGDSSLVSGAYLTSSTNYQTVIGKCNVADSNQVFIIGGGSASNDRKNIFTVSDTGYVKCVGLTDGTTTKTLTQVLSASGSSGTPYVSNTSLQQTQNTNTFYDYGNKGVPVTGEIHYSNEQIEFSQGSGSNGIVNEYSGQILADEYDVDLVTPNSIVWSECEGVENNNNVLTLEKNYTYQFSIVNNLGIICRWANGVIEAPVISSFVYPNVTWGAISGATNYNVAILKDSNYIPTPMGGIETTNTTLNVSNYFSQSQLSTPTNVSLSPSATSIVVTYNSVSNANQYTIYYKTSSASSYSSTTSTSTSKTISGLSANTNYSVYVVANNTSTSTLSARVKAMSPSLVDNTSEAVTCTYSPYTNSGESTPVTTLTKLSTPSPSISGSVVSWSSISGATYYIVTTSDGHASGNLSATSYNLNTWYDGSSAVNVTVYVTAYSSNNSSAVSNGVTYTITI